VLDCGGVLDVDDLADGLHARPDHWKCIAAVTSPSDFQGGQYDT